MQGVPPKSSAGTSVSANLKRIAFPDPEERTPTVLIVEDEALIRIALSDYLQECGFKILEAVNGEEAVKIIEGAHVTIDLVFSDVAMPGAIDGFALARWVRTHRPGLPIVLTSGDSRKAAAARDLCERESFLAKPYDLARVVAEIRAILSAKCRANSD